MHPETKEILDKLTHENTVLWEEIAKLREQVHDLVRALNRYSTCQHKACDLRCMKEKMK